jgi:hypothetical protein
VAGCRYVARIGYQAIGDVYRRYDSVVREPARFHQSRLGVRETFAGGDIRRSAFGQRLECDGGTTENTGDVDSTTLPGRGS